MLYLIYINPLNKDFKGQNTYEFIFTKRLDIVEYGEDWDVQPASSGTPTPPNVEQVDSVGILKTDEIELSLAIHSDTFSMYDCVEGIIALGWETESPEIDERLVFRYAETMESVKEKIYSRDKLLTIINKEEIEKMFGHTQNASVALNVRLRMILLIFTMCFVVMIYGVAILGWWFEEMTAVFFSTALPGRPPFSTGSGRVNSPCRSLISCSLATI